MSDNGFGQQTPEVLEKTVEMQKGVGWTGVALSAIVIILSIIVLVFASLVLQEVGVCATDQKRGLAIALIVFASIALALVVAYIVYMIVGMNSVQNLFQDINQRYLTPMREALGNATSRFTQ